jgi:cystathionine beta-lyase
MKAASKSFNIAGLISSYVIIPNPELRAHYNGFLMKSELNHAHVFATIATAAALSDEGAEWLSQMIDYVTANVDYLQAFLDEKMPLLKMIRPQASFLVFLDCRELNLSPCELQTFFTDKAHLALNEGSTFGEEGVGFMRMNVGCPRSTLREALDRLHVAYCELTEK